VGALVAALPVLSVGGQQPVHPALGGQVDALVKQRRVDLGRRRVDKARAVQLREDGVALGLTERTIRRLAWPRRPRRGRVLAAVAALRATMEFSSLPTTRIPQAGSA
jgi:hypothetical protein